MENVNCPSFLVRRFRSGHTVVPREIENIAYTKFWGVHYGQFENSDSGQYTLVIAALIDVNFKLT